VSSELFANLPLPQTVELLSYEVIFGQILAEFQTRNPSYSAFVESDPVIKLLEVAAAREVILRQRINDAFLSTLLSSAGSGDLDNLAVFYGVTRRLNETDIELRDRTILSTQGSSAAGGKSWYEYHALTASSDVRAANVTSPLPGNVQVAILSKIGNGVASAELLTAVRGVVAADNVRVLTDTLVVKGAASLVINITAEITFLPNAILTISDLDLILRNAFATEMVMGRDLTLSWISAVLSPFGGVQKVRIVTPISDLIVAGDQFAVIGTLILIDMGRGY